MMTLIPRALHCGQKGMIVEVPAVCHSRISLIMASCVFAMASCPVLFMALYAATMIARHWVSESGTTEAKFLKVVVLLTYG